MISTRFVAMVLTFSMVSGLLTLITLSAVPETQVLSTKVDKDFFEGSMGTPVSGNFLAQPLPTLAPPRKVFSVRESDVQRISTKGRPVFLRVETDNDEVEISWVSP
jgi:hypothetical protein